MPYCQYKNLDIHFTDSGKGRTIVLLHGFLENLTMWDDYNSVLSKKYRVVCIDLFGHGKTQNLAYVHTMEEMAESVKAVLDYLKLRKYIMLGHSMGGYVALAFADFFPDNILGLGLFYSTSFADSPEKKVQRQRAMELIKKDHKSYVRTSIPLLFRPKSLALYRKEVNAIKQDALKMSKQGILAAVAGMMARSDREALLHFAPFKTLIICGKRDTALPIEKMKLQLGAPNVSRYLITENGHMGHIEDKKVCLETILKFVKEV